MTDRKSDKLKDTLAANGLSEDMLTPNQREELIEEMEE